MQVRRALSCGSIIGISVAVAAPALAQDASETQVGEVVVTARKREERLRDIPTAGTAFGAQQIEQLGGISNTQELLANVPAVNFANTSSPVTSEVSIRGSGTSRATAAEAAVGLFRDGVYIGGGRLGGRTFSKADFFDVGAIEVLRGVQGALNGRNAVGGSINVVSARPASGDSGFIRGEVANNDRYDAQLVVNKALGDNWAVRFGAEYMDQDKGFYYNPVLDRYNDAQHTEIYRAQVAYNNGPLKVNLLAEHGWDLLPGLVYQVNIASSAIYPRGLFQGKYEVPWNTPSFGKQQVNYGELVIDYDFGFASLTSTSAVRERKSIFSYDRDASSPEFQALALAQGLVAPGVQQNDPNLAGLSLDFARVLYQDIHLVGKKSGGLSWLVGFEFFDLNDKYQNIQTRTPTRANPSAGVVGTERTDFTSWDVYGSLGFDITDRLNLTGEARYTKDDKSFLGGRLDFGTGRPSGVGFDIDDGKKSDNFSYTATASYKIMDWLTYAKVGTAYRAGGFNTALGDPRQPVDIPLTFDDEVATAYEVGVKGNISPSIFVTAAAFKSRVTDLLVQSDNGCFNGNPACPVQATPFVFNAGKADLWGIEVEVNSRFEVAGGVVLLTLGGSRLGGKIKSGPDAGKTAPQRPDWTANFALNYRRTFTNDLAAFFNINGNARWGGVQEIAQTPELYDYQILNARAGVERGPWQFAVYSNNFGDEAYIVFEGPSTRRWNLPRTYGAEVRYRW